MDQNNNKPRYNNSAKSESKNGSVNNNTESSKPEYLPMGVMMPDGSFKEIVKIPNNGALNDILHQRIFENVLPLLRDWYEEMNNPYHRIRKDKEG